MTFDKGGDAEVAGAGQEGEGPQAAGLDDLKSELEGRKADREATVFKDAREGLKADVVPQSSNHVEELRAMAEKYAETKPIIDKLQFLADEGEITPEQLAEFMDILAGMKPECWKGVRFVSFKIPMLHKLSRGTKISLDEDVSKMSFATQIAGHVWGNMLGAEEKEAIANIYKGLSREEIAASNWEKGGGFSGPNYAKWFCKAFACWFIHLEPYHSNIVNNPKLTPAVKLFESLKA